MAFLKGDHILIACGDRLVGGVIEMISKNEVSMLIHFGTVLNGHLGMMPVMRGEDGVYRSIVDGTEVRISKKRAGANER